MKKIYKADVAQSMDMSPIQFRHYIQAVKREFKVAPPTKVIRKHLLNTKASQPPVPNEIAKAISQQFGYPLKLGGQINQPHLKVSKATLARAQKKFERNILKRSISSPANTREHNVAPYSKFDHERVSEERLKHCPHGVPKTRVCGICDPEKYKELTGEG